MNELEKSFLNALNESFKEYNKKKGVRSNRKLIPMHSWFSEVLDNSPNYYVKSLGHGGEHKLEGKYYKKNLDIAILEKSNTTISQNDCKCIATISFTFVTGNYAQNSNNYFEKLLGETANIKRTGVYFTNFLVLRGHTPYNKRPIGNEKGKFEKNQILANRQINKYIELIKDDDFPHKPDVLGISVVDFDGNGNAYFTDLEKILLKKETINILKNEFSINTFIEKVKELCKQKS